MSGPAVVARGVGKWFGRRNPERTGTLQETLLRGLRRDHERDGFWALRDVTFEIDANRAVGLIGNNGAGKSTLLRLMGGVGRPDEGDLTVSGRVGALLDLSAGFHGDLSGRENVYVAGVVAGLTQKEVRQRFDEIVDFADLSDFIDNPYRTYSAGMQMRLGFAVAIHADPETLLMDELLSVGDHAFQRKCLQRIISLRERGTTVMLASHDSILVRRVCEDAIWLQDGRVVEFGDAAEAVGHYLAAPDIETRRRTPVDSTVVTTAGGAELRFGQNRFGSQELQIAGVRLLDRMGRVVEALDGGDSLRVEIDYDAKATVASPVFTVAVSRDDGIACCETSTAACGLTMPDVGGTGTVALEIERLDLNRGDYCVDVCVYAPGWSHAYDHHVDVYPLAIRTGVDESAVMNPPHVWDVRGVPGLQPRSAGVMTLR